jgi:hypothetical protein
VAKTKWTLILMGASSLQKKLNDDRMKAEKALRLNGAV